MGWVGGWGRIKMQQTFWKLPENLQNMEDLKQNRTEKKCKNLWPSHYKIFLREPDTHPREKKETERNQEQRKTKLCGLIKRNKKKKPHTTDMIINCKNPYKTDRYNH